MVAIWYRARSEPRRRWASTLVLALLATAERVMAPRLDPTVLRSE